MTASVTDEQRHRLQDALTAALLMIYAGKAQEALYRLGIFETQYEISPEARATIAAFATDRAQKIQAGINQRLTAAGDADGLDAQQLAVGHAKNEIAQYTHGTLMPFLLNWASQQALLDVYRATPDRADPSQSAADAQQWEWTRNTDWLYDDCQEAEDASPAPLDDLLAITGGPPPIHPNCACQLGPA